MQIQQIGLNVNPNKIIIMSQKNSPITILSKMSTTVSWSGIQIVEGKPNGRNHMKTKIFFLQIQIFLYV